MDQQEKEKMIAAVLDLKNKVEQVFTDHVHARKAEGASQDVIVGECVSTAVSIALSYAAAIEMPPETLMRMYAISILQEIKRSTEQLDEAEEVTAPAQPGGPDPTSN